MSRLDRNLQTLAICYRIGGVLLALAVTFLVVTFGSMSTLGGSINLPGLIFPLLVLLLGAALVFTLFEVASALRNHERRTFCLVVAWLTCAAFPIGAVLGVFTILQLIQPEAEEAFAVAETRNMTPEGLGAQPGHATEP